MVMTAASGKKQMREEAAGDTVTVGLSCERPIERSGGGLCRFWTLFRWRCGLTLRKCLQRKNQVRNFVGCRLERHTMATSQGEISSICKRKRG